ncbi:hypothetical protein CYMTET_33391, partial [Cymbomonas tetramitiformis]
VDAALQALDILASQPKQNSNTPAMGVSNSCAVPPVASSAEPLANLQGAQAVAVQAAEQRGSGKRAAAPPGHGLFAEENSAGKEDPSMASPAAEAGKEQQEAGKKDPSMASPAATGTRNKQELSRLVKEDCGLQNRHEAYLGRSSSPAQVALLLLLIKTCSTFRGLLHLLRTLVRISGMTS